MVLRPKFFRLPRKAGLSPEQIAMYSQERMMNFRWISRIMATYSKHRLTDADTAPANIAIELSELGQFAEVAFGSVPTKFVFDHLSTLLETDFPLEGYNALRGSVLVSHIRGKVANLGAYVAYRPNVKQLIVAISGTSNLKQALQDVRTLKHKHPADQGCAVHTGFWKMYEGIKSGVFDAVQTGLQQYEVSELVITGHSMGGALSYFLAIDILAPGGVQLPSRLPLKIAVFGAPRCGNQRLQQFWCDLTKEYRSKNGEDSLKEYSIKAYNDGVPSLPPKSFGFRHFSSDPLYLMKGRLYQVPSSESEFCLFHVEGDEKDLTIPHPLGGHNYYFLDMEKFWRRMGWMISMMADEGWEVRYKAKVAKQERGWIEKTKQKMTTRLTEK